mmetsp:Transcript_3046/g.4971  ORF Transcript_3046/g.4971 Transcript_3046/m.4971 type:complete len:305 (+) Transcript_3046:437-1351(+)
MCKSVETCMTGSQSFEITVSILISSLFAQSVHFPWFGVRSSSKIVYFHLRPIYFWTIWVNQGPRRLGLRNKSVAWKGFPVVNDLIQQKKLASREACCFRHLVEILANIGRWFNHHERPIKSVANVIGWLFPASGRSLCYEGSIVIVHKVKISQCNAVSIYVDHSVIFRKRPDCKLATGAPIPINTAKVRRGGLELAFLLFCNFALSKCAILFRQLNEALPTCIFKILQMLFRNIGARIVFCGNPEHNSVACGLDMFQRFAEHFRSRNILCSGYERYHCNFLLVCCCASTISSYFFRCLLFRMNR